MIVSASRKTDIPAFYAGWFYNRLIENYLYVRNPVNPKQTSELKLSRDTVDCSVSWTKNPGPMMDRPSTLDTIGYPYHFQFTLTVYGQDMEPGLSDKRGLVEASRTLSRRIEAERVIQGYDPILLGGAYNVEYHCRWFEQLCKNLSGYIQTYVISFIDVCARTKKSMEHMGVYDMGDGDTCLLASLLGPIAKQCRIGLQTRLEAMDLSEYGTQKGKCIDDHLISQITGREVDVRKDDTQRGTYGCVKSVDIGTYHACAHLYRYCYANLNPPQAQENRRQHDLDPPFLIGRLNGEEKITQRVMKSVFRHSDDGQVELQWQVKDKRHLFLQQDRVKQDRMGQDRMNQERVGKNRRHLSANAGRTHSPVPFIMKVAPLPAALLCGLMSVLANPGFAFAEENWDQDAEITAHRGDVPQAPGNTIPAFKAVIENGADWIESDINQTEDGVLVILHDENLMCVAGVPHKVRDFAYDEIRSLDVGSRLRLDFQGIPIPTLSEVLDYRRGEVKPSIEVKYREEQSLELIPQMVEMIRQREMLQECMTTSFNYGCLQMVEIFEPSLETGPISSQPVPQPEIYTSADNFVLSIELIEPDTMNRTHGLGKEVIAWTINDQYSVDKRKRARVDNIIADRPDDILSEQCVLCGHWQLFIAVTWYFYLQTGIDQVQVFRRSPYFLYITGIRCRSEPGGEIMRIPKHIGIIPDRNRRWAQSRGTEKADGYSHGTSLGMILYYTCRELGAEEMSFHGFTVSNTKHPTIQYQALTKACVAAVGELSKEDASLLVLGNTQSNMFPPEFLPYTTGQDSGAGGMKINFLVNYSWEWDPGSKPGPRTSGESAISRPASIGPGLKTAGVPRVDLTIRWGSRRRLSGLLPVQSVYPGVYVVDDYWPDFRRQHVEDVIKRYSAQDVTLGG